MALLTVVRLQTQRFVTTAYYCSYHCGAGCFISQWNPLEPHCNDWSWVISYRVVLVIFWSQVLAWPPSRQLQRETHQDPVDRHSSQPKDAINIHQLTKHFWTSQCSETREDCNFLPTMSSVPPQREGNIQVRDFHLMPSGQNLARSCTHLQLGGGSCRWSEWLQHETPRRGSACSRHQSTWDMDDPWNGKTVSISSCWASDIQQLLTVMTQQFSILAHACAPSLRAGHRQI